MGGERLIGRWGEQIAARLLSKKGYHIRGMNYSCRFGEIDVIAENRDYIAFVEVKLRKNAAHGLAREFVTPAKQRRVILAAQLWLSVNPTRKQPRFDVVEVYGAAGKVDSISHIENAFTL